MKGMKFYSSLLGLALGAAVSTSALAQDVIKIGELNSYKTQPAFLGPYKNGMDLAISQINESGGLLGKKVELIIRDDNSNTGDAVRAAEELISRDKVDVLTGTFLSHIGLAVTDFAKQKQRFFLASEPLTDKIVWGDGNRYTFRLRTSTYMQVAMLVPEAVKLNKKRWAVVYPNYEYGQSAVNTFKTLMKAAQPDIEFVAEQASPLGKVDAGSVIQALSDAKADAVFNVLFAADLAKLVRAGSQRNYFDNVPVVSLLTGEPEYLDPLGNETPEGWIVTGYPWYAIDTPEHKAFLEAYQAKFNDYPRLGTVVGYAAIMSLAEGIKKAGSTDTEALIKAFRGLELMSPFGPITYRPQDHQSTMGIYVGKLAKKDGKGIMTDFVYVDGKSVQPSDEQVKEWRKAAE
ncbi:MULTISPECIES: ABC transporter substrate-binding protein [unclassified Pusillimonas]|uniref:ABC transporter substrate-binding protein n=1 Tax=unclassified Pusillimonas TaxID=2640016 RepID=UPI000B9D1E37|nr:MULTISPECIES: ABC transporter substrate-binding protein [unclassified Pusillimonas]OXR49103.1 ABC transporter substrate-binding protein [Pusillimonas sp. T2]ROT45984.1 ABC transporter substrate-binding protein [Pusillimonas sp. NJUB218]